MNYIVHKLMENHLIEESFEYKGYKYYKYGGLYYRRRINPDGSYEEEKPITYDMYSGYRTLSNEDKPSEYKDLDDETIEDVRRLSKLKSYVSADDDLSLYDKQRYLMIIDKYLEVSVTHNIPVSDYSHRNLRDRRYLSELNNLLSYYLDSKVPPDSHPQEYEPIRRKYN